MFFCKKKTFYFILACTESTTLPGENACSCSGVTCPGGTFCYDTQCEDGAKGNGRWEVFFSNENTLRSGTL